MGMDSMCECRCARRPGLLPGEDESSGGAAAVLDYKLTL